MLNWLWKWLGYHVCEVFTPWEISTRDMEWLYFRNGQVVSREPFIEEYQQRTCKTCGKAERRTLP